ncbi:MAG: DUF2027 domain-containing protein [Bacteroidales bacterium]|jgi:hypothetical protein|nr:DUF2027 domain-containing protein [Bacteroidales bacterium]MDD4214550.1 DUF2027 domain-containing protein [Bacteroidales bacterium]
MKFKVGDKVKFLNEKGGGIVSKIISNTLVHVAVSDGFEIPVMVNELILINSNTAAQKYFDNEPDLPPANISDTSSQNFNTPEPARKPYDIPAGIYICIVPLDQRLLIAGDAEIWLINNTGFDMIYALFLKDINGYLGNDYGSIPAFSKTNIQLADREQTEYYTNGVLQLLFFSDFIENIAAPVNKEYKFKAVKLLKEDNYIENSVFNKKAFIYKIYELPATDSKDVEKPASITDVQLKRDSLIHKHKIEDGFAEVDLHIETLCEEHVSLSKHEKMQVQLDYFTRCLENAISENYERVIFIHGVGAGVLKLEITKILEQYSFLEYFDASIARYGIGATEVLIYKKNK